jgi:hypothetical protein
LFCTFCGCTVVNNVFSDSFSKTYLKAIIHIFRYLTKDCLGWTLKKKWRSSYAIFYLKIKLGNFVVKKPHRKKLPGFIEIQ